MSALDSLVRLHRLNLDEARKVLGERQHQRASMLAEIQRLDEELDAERQSAAKSFEAGMAYGSFSAAVKERKLAIAFVIEEIDESIAEATDVVAAAYRELKKYEVAAERRAAEREREAAQREQLELDETALTIYRRRGGDRWRG